MIKIVQALFANSMLIVILVLSGTKFNNVPPLAKFFDPFGGFWNNAEVAGIPLQEELKIQGLVEPVNVIYDDRGIPHIFAENDHDLYMAQGFVTARDRLWQMEFQTHAAAGRLSEILGDISLGKFTTLDFDLHQRRIGMVYGADNILLKIQADTLMMANSQAHSDGVNAYINALSPRDYPLEYKVLSYSPEEWNPRKTALLLMLMLYDLSGSSSDLQMSNTLTKLGKELTEKLFLNYPPKMQPIIPEKTDWLFQIRIPESPKGGFTPKVGLQVSPIQPNPYNGSNSWALSGKRTDDGFPILANDPHLALKLPSVWYELQLSAPGVNVYGVSLPGAPNIIIGFNEKIAWGVTNGGDDVMDWYEIKFKDNELNEYWHDEQWKPVQKVVESIAVRNGAVIRDTVLYTHHGPVSLKPGQTSFNRSIPVGHALRWSAHSEVGDESRAFFQLNRAQNYDEFTEALRHYAGPPQNFTFADQRNIALWHNGMFPNKWRDQGKYISDGTDPAYDWQGWTPHEHKPHIKNPKQGFISSANQNPTAPAYPYYLGWDFAPYYRAARINEWLSSTSNAQPDDIRVMLLDNKNLKAEAALPIMISALDSVELSEQCVRVLAEVKGWDYFNDANKIGPTIFTVWWDNLNAAIWADEFDPNNFLWPPGDRTIQLMREERSSLWFDNKQTAEVENLNDLLLTTFQKTCRVLDAKYGAPGKKWRWGKHKGTDIAHLAHIPGLSDMNLNVGGDKGIINATSSTHGPSWRMVVSLGSEVEAWGIYPGGQSGNPGSKRYNDFVDEWVAGELAELLFLKSKDEKNARIIGKLELN